MEFKGNKSSWNKINAKRMGVPFIIVSGDETIFHAYGEQAEANATLIECAHKLLEALKSILNEERVKEAMILSGENSLLNDRIKSYKELIEKATTI